MIIKFIKILALTVLVNSILFPFYSLRYLDSIRDILDVGLSGLLKMLYPTAYIVGVHFLLMRLSKNWFQKSIDYQLLNFKFENLPLL